MRSNLLSIILWIAPWLMLASAYGERGASERALIFFTYQLEGLVYPKIKPPPPFTVAPGCKGTAAGGRCSLSELMQHLWLPDPDDPKQLLTSPPQVKLHYQEYTLGGIMGAIAKFRGGPQKDITLLKALDYEKVNPAAADFYDAMGRLGNQLLQAMTQSGLLTVGEKDWPPKGSPFLANDKERIEKNYKLGVNAAELTRVLREKDMEYFRCKDRLRGLMLPKYLGVVPVTKKQIPDPKFTGRLYPYDVLDVQATMLKHSISATKMTQVTDQWATDDHDHTRAIAEARRSELACRCAQRP